MSNSATATASSEPRPDGLEGVVAATTALSHVYGEEGKLVYRGYDIHELAGKASFEEVAYLLWNGNLPTNEELKEFSDKVGHFRVLPPKVIEGLRAWRRRAQAFR
jgi:citrate synthase